jgi:hypothetical protein
MTDKEYRLQKKRVQKYIDKWFKTLGLGWFTVDFEWCRERDNEVPSLAGMTHSSWQYKSATIIWFVPVLAEHSDETVENVVIHEFTHVLLSGLAQNQIDGNDKYAKQINEYTTEVVANAFGWSRAAGQNDS